MPRSRSQSTSSLPGNLMASWSIQSYPASRVEDAVEDLPSETHYPTAVQLAHEQSTEEMTPPPVSSSFQSIQPPVFVDATIKQDIWFSSFAPLQHSSTLPPSFMDHLPPAQLPPSDFISEINHDFEHSRHTHISNFTSIHDSERTSGAHAISQYHPPIDFKPALPVFEHLRLKTPYPDIYDWVTYEHQAEERSLICPPVSGPGSDTVNPMSGYTFSSAQYPMAPLPQILPPTYPPPSGTHPLIDWQGYAYQHTSLPTYTHSTTYPSTHTQWPTYSSNYTYTLPTYAHPTTYPSTYTPWHSNSLDSTYLSANPYPVNTTCRQDTHHPFFSGSQYLDRGLPPPPSPKLSDAKASAQVWEGRYYYEITARYMHALSLMFEYWTSQDVSRRCVIINLTSPRTMT